LAYWFSAPMALMTPAEGPLAPAPQAPHASKRLRPTNADAAARPTWSADGGILAAAPGRVTPMTLE
jgi:hypothetical protein